MVPGDPKEFVLWANGRHKDRIIGADDYEMSMEMSPWEYREWGAGLWDVLFLGGSAIDLDKGEDFDWNQALGYADQVARNAVLWLWRSDAR